MRERGLLVDELEVGRLRRCRVEDDRGAEKSGWYCLHELTRSGSEIMLVGAFGNWREGVGSDGRPRYYRVDIGKAGLPSKEKAAIKTRIAEDRRRAKAQQRSRAQRAARRAAAGWAQCSADGDCDYLHRKQVSAFGVRFSPSGNMAVPIQDTSGRLHGLQVIYADPGHKKRHGRDKSYWPAGVEKRGNFHLIGAPSWVVMVCEGYATGASLHMATGWPVAIAFDAGNLDPVACQLRARYPGVCILLCADDDGVQSCRACRKRTRLTAATCEHCGEPHGKSNAGIKAASVAALAAHGAWTGPHFSERGDAKLTDFNDLALAEGLQAVRAQIEGRVDELGWRANKAVGQRENGHDRAESFHFDMDVLLRDYALIYSTETVFDSRRRLIVSLGPLRSAAGKALVRMWLEHPERRTVMPEQVVFSPERDPDDPGICNIWGGWPTRSQSGRCESLLDLLEFLCSREENTQEVYRWLLRWLAYPVQHPGAKMQTAVLMHGPEGSGKNTFFAQVRKIYGRYGCTFGQVELESQFNGWASGKLFGIGNEVVTRAELYQQQGRLKTMITEPEWLINEKNLPTRQEPNHCNFIFFSNRLDIAKLGRRDRRYCVIWTPEPCAPAFYEEVAAEIRDGGVEALHDYLLQLDLAGFTPHTKPPATRSKAELIDLGMDSLERFCRDWLEGHIGLPKGPCLSQDLYDAYRQWAQREGIHRPTPQYVLLGAISKHPEIDKRRARYYKGQRKVNGTVVFPRADNPPDDTNQTAWVSERIAKFRAAVNDYREGGRL